MIVKSYAFNVEEFYQCMTEIISYFIERLPLKIALAEYPEAISVAHFVYVFENTQNSFHYYHNDTSPFINLLKQLKLFIPITLTFQKNEEGNEEITTEFLTKITRTPGDLHINNPFIYVSFTEFTDNTRHFCSPTDIPNPPRITLFDNKENPLPHKDILYTHHQLVQFTTIFNPNHRSYGYPRIKALKAGNSILIPSPSIINGIIPPKQRELSKKFTIYVFSSGSTMTHAKT